MSKLPPVINTSTLLKILDVTLPQQNILLIGDAGIGKSNIITSYYESQKRVVTLFLGQLSDQSDLLGLPNKNLESNRTDFLPPYWWPSKEEPIVLFLDELNRASKDILSAVFDLCLNRSLAGRKLPENSVVIAAINEGEDYLIQTLDKGLISRFNVYRFAPTSEEWLLWANNNDIDSRIIHFISTSKYQYLLDSDGIDEDIDESITVVPDRRRWARVSDLIKNSNLEPENEWFLILAGIIGQKAAACFLQYVKEQNPNLISGEIILNNCNKELLEKINSSIEIVRINNEIFEVLNSSKSCGPKWQANLISYLQWLKEYHSEQMLNFVSLYTSCNFKKANTRLANLFSETLDFLEKELEGLA